MSYKAILHTGNRTGERKKFGQAIDGMKAIIGDAIGGDGYFILFPDDEESGTKYMKALYECEGEGYDDFDDFKEDYEQGEIFPSGYITIGKDEAEITERFNGVL